MRVQVAAAVWSGVEQVAAAALGDNAGRQADGHLAAQPVQQHKCRDECCRHVSVARELAGETQQLAATGGTMQSSQTAGDVQATCKL